MTDKMRGHRQGLACVATLLISGPGIWLSYRKACPVWNDLWQTAGGSAEPGENASEAAVREVLEETGLRIGIERLRCYGSEHVKGPYGGKRYLYWFGVELTEFEIPVNTEPHMHGDWEWVWKQDVMKRSLLPGFHCETIQKGYFEAP